MPTDIGQQFDLYCRNHPGQVIDDRARASGDRLCSVCYLQAWNAGARQADAHWADDPTPRYTDEELMMHQIGRSKFGKELTDE